MPRNKTEKGKWQPQDNKTLLEKSHLRKEMIARLRNRAVCPGDAWRDR